MSTKRQVTVSLEAAELIMQLRPMIKTSRFLATILQFPVGDSVVLMPKPERQINHYKLARNEMIIKRAQIMINLLTDQGLLP